MVNSSNPAIITERGVMRAPYAESLKEMELVSLKYWPWIAAHQRRERFRLIVPATSLNECLSGNMLWWRMREMKTYSEAGL